MIKKREGDFSLNKYVVRACPACPDGQVWNANGPTGQTCPICKGHAMVRLNGEPVTDRRTK